MTDSVEPTLRTASQVLKGVHVLRISGEVDLSVKQQFEQALKSAVEGVHSPLVIDLEGVQYMDSMGFNALLNAQRQMMARNDKLYIGLQNHHLQKVFAILGFDKIFRKHGTLDDALAAASRE